MAGHSKWANIKHKKAKADAVKGKMFTKLAREIMIAAREGGGDPNTNFRLRLAVEKAKSINMPNDNINRAILRGTGEIGAEQVEEMVYEGYGPGGVAVYLDIVTDNRNRTAGDIRHIFSKYGGNLGETGCVAWMFDKKGLFVVEKEDGQLPGGLDEDTLLMLALEAGAEDVQSHPDYVEIITDPAQFDEVQEKLSTAGVKYTDAEITMIPNNKVNLDEETALKLAKLITALDDYDDVQNVYYNADIPDEVFEKIE
ncbi:MAG: YebC/PmpR family DNA-binding transcriptional regulator [Firmicutes bacterium]|nr:YebC/PmpR family DNA-binding transcriptional regulator [Bacillota bacterium]